MKTSRSILLTFLFLGMMVPASADEASRNATLRSLRASLNEAGKLSDVDASFETSKNDPFTLVSTMTGLPNVDSLEIVIRVTPNDTLNFRVYPHYDGGYINLDSAKDSNRLMRQLLLLSDQNFLYWGVDDTSDVFSGYTITLESGYPKEAVEMVLRSIRNTDRFVGQMRPFIDGTQPVKK